MQGICRHECFPWLIFLLLCNIMAWFGVSSQTCPNVTLIISCNITTAGPVTTWVVPPGYCPSNSIILSQPPGTDCGSKNDSCGPFVATNLVPPSGQACTTSVLSVVASPQLNGTNISCYSNDILQHQQIISITTPPSLPLVTVSPIGNGLVVSFTSSGYFASYDITVEPNGTHIITASNGLVEQNIPGLLPNTKYTVRVIAINCAGSSGVVAVNATTGHNIQDSNDTAQPPFPQLITVLIAIGVGLLIMVIVIAAVIMVVLCKRYFYSTKNPPQHELDLQSQPQPNPTLRLSEPPKGMFPELNQAFIIVYNEAPCSGHVLQVGNRQFVYLKEKQTPPSNDQLWYRKVHHDGSFAIVSKHNGRALKHDLNSSQVVLCDVNEEGDLWAMEDNNIVCKATSELMYIYPGNHDALFCGDKDKEEVKKQNKPFTFQEGDFIIVYNEEPFFGHVLQVNMQFVHLKEKQTPSSKDQLWYRKVHHDGSFAIVNHNGRALKLDLKSSQVVLCDVNEEEDLWAMEDNKLVCKATSELMYMYPDNHGTLYCGDKEKKKVKKQKKPFTFQEVKEYCSPYSIEHIETGFFVVVDQKDPCQLVCSSNKPFKQTWYKKFTDDANGKCFMIVATLNNGKLLLSCTIEGKSREKADYLWKEEDEHIVSVKYGLVIGVQVSEKGASLILCRKEESAHKLKMISFCY